MRCSTKNRNKKRKDSFSIKILDRNFVDWSKKAIKINKIVVKNSKYA